MDSFVLGQFLSAKRYDDILAEVSKDTNRSIRLDPANVLGSYNTKPFTVSHDLAGNEHFSLPSLFALCRRFDPAYLGIRPGEVPIDTEFDTAVQRYGAGMQLEDLLENFEARKGYIVINNPERDPEYKTVIERLVGEIGLQINPVDPCINWYSTYVFITARGAITPYHMDREMNFLLQLRGTKSVLLWDALDDEIMSSEQRDRLLCYDGVRPTYKPSFDSKATRFQLEPGIGVHHPFIAPHLVQTGPELSISLAITFRTRLSDRWTDAHRVNHRLRRMKLRPTPVRHNSAVDGAKSALLAAYRRAVGKD